MRPYVAQFLCSPDGYIRAGEHVCALRIASKYPPPLFASNATEGCCVALDAAFVEAAAALLSPNYGENKE